MSKQLVLGLVLLSAIAACQKQQPDVYVPAATDPVTTEPVYQGKFGAN